MHVLRLVRLHIHFLQKSSLYGLRDVNWLIMWLILRLLSTEGLTTRLIGLRRMYTHLICGYQPRDSIPSLYLTILRIHS